MELAVGTSAADVPMNLKNNKILQNVQVAIWCNALSWSAQASVLGKLDVLRNCLVLHVLAVTWCKQRCSMLGVAGVFGVPCVLGVLGVLCVCAVPRVIGVPRVLVVHRAQGIKF